jgi:hypothetical protein
MLAVTIKPGLRTVYDSNFDVCIRFCLYSLDLRTITILVEFLTRFDR